MCHNSICFIVCFLSTILFSVKEHLLALNKYIIYYLDQIFTSPCWRRTDRLFPDARMLLQMILAPSAICPSSNVLGPLPLKLYNSLGYVGDPRSTTKIVISDSITQRTPSIVLLAPTSQIRKSSLSTHTGQRLLA